MRIPTLRDVAQRAGVHPSTVSRALNPETRSRVNAVTARRVSAAARSLGYQPNTIARSLRTNRTSTVGMLVPDLTNPLFPPTVRGVEDVLAEHAYTVLLVNTDNDQAREARQFEALRSRQVEGLILATARHGDPVTPRALDGGLPVVLIHDVIEGVRVRSVVADNAAGTRTAVSHVADLGHERIAHLAGPQDASPAVERLEAFRQAAHGRGLLREDLVVVCASFGEHDGATAFAKLLDEHPEVTAVVAASDLLAMGVYDVMTERGIDCPAELSVVGFHDMPFVDKLRPPLTTVRVPHYQMGAEAARMLVDQLERAGGDPTRVIVPVELIERGSTAAPRAGALRSPPR